MGDRAIIYLRQSAARDDSISLELQETACRAHAERRGYVVVGVEADPGISGRTFNRPAVQRVMKAVEDRTVDVVLLWKWSRLSRNRRDWAVAADAIEQAGGRVESATEDVDLTTSTGRFTRGMLVEMAAFESDRIGDQWRETHARRVLAGLPANGKPRFGYRRSGDGFEPDPETGQLLAEAYERYISGESVYTLTRWLNEIGVTTVAGYGSSGGEWSARTLRRVLDSGFGAGLIRVRGELLDGAHDPVISMDVWEDYQAARARRRVVRGAERSQYLLSGLVRCQCGSSMSAGQFGWQRVPKYRCKAAAEKGRHPGGYVTTRVLETAVLAWLRSLVDEIGVRADAHMRLQEAKDRAVADADRLAAQITKAEAAITRLTVTMAEGGIPLDAYRSALGELEGRRDTLVSRHAEVVARDRVVPASPEVAERLLEVWDVLPVEQRREALRGLLDHVVVSPGRPRSRVEIVPVWGR